MNYSIIMYYSTTPTVNSTVKQQDIVIFSIFLQKERNN